MKIKIESSRLQDGLKKVIAITSQKTAIPALGNVKVEAKDGKVDLTATNLEITLKTSVDCEVAEPCVTTVPSKMLLNIVSALPVGMVDVDIDEQGRMRLSSGETAFCVSVMDANDFPKLANVKGDLTFSLEAKSLRALLRKTAYAQSKDDTRRTLKCILFDFAGGRLKTVATDGRRLAVAVASAEWKCADTKFTLPSDAVRELQRLLTDDGGVTVRYSGGMAVFSIEKASTVMYCKTFEDPYPDYLRAIPNDVRDEAVLDRARLVDMMNRAKVMAVSAQPSVKMTFGEGVLSSAVVGCDNGESRDMFEVKYGGEKMELVLNPYYLHETASVLDEDEIAFGLVGEGSPIVIRSKGDGSLAVMMPLRSA